MASSPSLPRKSRESSFVNSRKGDTGSRPVSRDSGSTRSGVNASRRNSLIKRIALATTPTPSNQRRRSIVMSSPTGNDDDLYPRAGGGEEQARQVASRYSSKVSDFVDFYNEALRRRLIRELEKPTPAVVPESEMDGLADIAELSERWDRATTKVTAATKLASGGRENTARKLKKVSLRHISRQNKIKSLQEVQKMLRRVEVRKRFRKKARIIIFCIRCVKEHCFRFRENSELTPYLQTLNYIDYSADQVSDLLFDRSLFRAKRQMRISEETKKILSTEKSERTDTEIYTAQIALRNIRSFAELPVRMQKMIAQAGQYESYEGKRVISREGHPAAAFYFILSGAVVAMKKDPDRSMASVVEHYSKGDTFEEEPLLNETLRNVTVLTKEPCEFLSISAVDYKNIFMQGGVKTLNDPDQESFFKSLSFLHDWPISILSDHPKECRFHYFRRGAILADDTKKDPWLIVVKSGSLSVMKKLKKVCPFEWRKKSDIKPLTEKERRERKHAKEQWRRYVLPELRLPLRPRGDVEEIEERVDGKPKPFMHPVIKVHFEESQDRDRKQKYYYPNLWTFTRADKEEEEGRNATFSNINKKFLYTISKSGDGKSATPAAGQGRLKTKSAVEREAPATPQEHDTHIRPTSEKAQAPSRSESPVSLRSLLSPSGSEDTQKTTSSVFSERLKQIMAENYFESLSDLDLNPQFVQIKTLIKGDVWGLADLMLDKQPSFIIVSNGADCVQIKKSFYLQNCSEKLQRDLKQSLCPYPSDDNLQESLQISVDWNAHRKSELEHTMGQVHTDRFLKQYTVAR
ncbi:uncharacterized protein LOC127864903 [Dreissena polymorpha]|nr:uncharacterized protein LOC127864903 [Dreissena polymorpha]